MTLALPSLADRIAESLRDLSPEDRAAYVASIPAATRDALARQDWAVVARPDQIEPEGDWSVWWLSGGRGSGKSRTGSETTRKWAESLPSVSGVPTEWAVVGRRFRDARDICMEGPSGLLGALERRGYRRGRDYRWNRSQGTLDLTATRQRFHAFGADDKDAGRGLNLAGAWLDEVGMWPYAEATWNEAIAPALRIGPRPRVIVTSTPKPRALLREWSSRTDGSVHITRVSTFANASNLSVTALAELRLRYEGTRIGRQELYGELIDDVEGALWTWAMIADRRIDHAPSELVRIVVAVDPALTAHPDSDETGIVVAGLDKDRHYYVLADRSGRWTPLEWARRVIAAYDEFGADRIVYERNAGGDLLVRNLAVERQGLPLQDVTASKSKKARAQPIAALYEQGRVHHVEVADLSTLEAQMTEWVPDSGMDSPDRLDALVYALDALAPSMGSATDALFASLTVECWKCGVANQKSTPVCNCGANLHTATNGRAPIGAADLTGLTVRRG